MKIYDLTKGKYHQITDDMDSKEKKRLENIEYFKTMPLIENFMRLNHEVKTNFNRRVDSSLLNDVPIFLVDRTMVNKYVDVPNCSLTLRVPEDKGISLIDAKDFNIEDWVMAKEKECFSKECLEERQSDIVSIYDLLGAYFHIKNADILPRRIFIWVDKIVDYAYDHSLNQEDTATNVSTLLFLIIFHELGHALMDVELYGAKPSPHFSYEKDYVYQFIEEAYANCIALTWLYQNNKDLNFHCYVGGSNKTTNTLSSQEQFIKNFVMNQGPGYSDGWMIYENLWHYLWGIDQWMCTKTLFNYDFALLLRDFWNNKDFSNLNYVSSRGYGRFFSVKRSHGKYGLLDTFTMKIVSEPYDHIDSFTEGLCRVKRNDLYGCINEQGEMVIPLAYDYISEFKDGFSVVKKDDKWGAINAKNKVVIPIVKDSESIVCYQIKELSQHNNNPTDKSDEVFPKVILPAIIKKLITNMVYVEGGIFTLGDISGRRKDADQYSPYQVELSSFFIGRYLVTQEEWEAVMGNNPSIFKGAKRPVENVGWKDCQIFIRKINEMTGLSFRLPTAAEWEVTARGGNKSHKYLYSGSNILYEVGWVFGDEISGPDHGTHPVGRLSPNELGIYDMSGNVFEWCYDLYENRHPSSFTNPKGPTSGSEHVTRGGCWMKPALEFWELYRHDASDKGFCDDDSTPPSNTTDESTRLKILISQLEQFLPEEKRKERESTIGLRLAL